MIVRIVTLFVYNFNSVVGNANVMFGCHKAAWLSTGHDKKLAPYLKSTIATVIYRSTVNRNQIKDIYDV